MNWLSARAPGVVDQDLAVQIRRIRPLMEIRIPASGVGENSRWPRRFGRKHRGVSAVHRVVIDLVGDQRAAGHAVDLAR